MKIIKRDFKSWPVDIRVKLRNLTNSSDHIESGMIDYLDDHPHDDPITFVAFVKNNPIGWAMIVRKTNWSSIMVYVHKDYRRKGIGSTLVRRATKTIDRCLCYVWNRVSHDFYKIISTQSKCLVPLDWRYGKSSKILFTQEEV